MLPTKQLSQGTEIFTFHFNSYSIPSRHVVFNCTVEISEYKVESQCQFTGVHDVDREIVVSLLVLVHGRHNLYGLGRDLDNIQKHAISFERPIIIAVSIQIQILIIMCDFDLLNKTKDLLYHFCARLLHVVITYSLIFTTTQNH